MTDERIRSGEANISNWVKEGINLEAIEFAEEFGKYLVNLRNDALTTAQIRNVFGEVRKIQMNNQNNKSGYSESAILLLLPKLAYAAKRAKTKGAQKLADVLSPGIRAVVEGDNEDKKQENFENFANFFEAVLAYHKANNGK